MSNKQVPSFLPTGVFRRKHTTIGWCYAKASKSSHAIIAPPGVKCEFLSALDVMTNSRQYYSNICEMAKNEDISNLFEVTNTKTLSVENIFEKNKYLTILFFRQHYTHLQTYKSKISSNCAHCNTQLIYLRH